MTINAERKHKNMEIEYTPEEFKQLIGKLPVPQEKSTWLSFETTLRKRGGRMGEYEKKLYHQIQVILAIQGVNLVILSISLLLILIRR